MVCTFYAAAIVGVDNNAANFWEIYKADMEKRLRKTTMKQKEYVMDDKVLPYLGKMPINEITAP